MTNTAAETSPVVTDNIPTDALNSFLLGTNKKNKTMEDHRVLAKDATNGKVG